MLLLCRCRRPPICNASRKKLFEPAGLTQEFRILCWFLETNAGFENPERDFGNRRRFSETNAGFQNSARDFENSCWVSKTNAGFENPEQDFENRRRFFRNQRRISKTRVCFRKPTQASEFPITPAVGFPKTSKAILPRLRQVNKHDVKAAAQRFQLCNALKQVPREIDPGLAFCMNFELIGKSDSEARIYRRDGNAELAPSRKLKPSNARWMKS